MVPPSVWIEYGRSVAVDPGDPRGEIPPLLLSSMQVGAGGSVPEMLLAPAAAAHSPALGSPRDARNLMLRVRAARPSRRRATGTWHTVPGVIAVNEEGLPAGAPSCGRASAEDDYARLGPLEASAVEARRRRVAAPPRPTVRGCAPPRRGAAAMPAAPGGGSRLAPSVADGVGAAAMGGVRQMFAAEARGRRRRAASPGSPRLTSAGVAARGSCARRGRRCQDDIISEAVAAQRARAADCANPAPPPRPAAAACAARARRRCRRCAAVLRGCCFYAPQNCAAAAAATDGQYPGPRCALVAQNSACGVRSGGATALRARRPRGRSICVPSAGHSTPQQWAQRPAVRPLRGYKL